MIRMFPNHLKLTQKIASTRNLQSTNIRIVTDANQQSKLSKNKQGIYLTNQTKNIGSIAALSASTFWIKH